MDYSKFVPKRIIGNPDEFQIQQNFQKYQDPVLDITYLIKAIKNTAVQVDEANLKMTTQFTQDIPSHRFNSSKK